MKKIIATPNAPAAIGPYAQAVDGGSVLITSGQLGLDPTTGELAQGIEAQTRPGECEGNSGPGRTDHGQRHQDHCVFAAHERLCRHERRLR